MSFRVWVKSRSRGCASHRSREHGAKRKSGSLSYCGPGWSCPVSQSEPIRSAKSIPAVDGESHTGRVLSG